MIHKEGLKTIGTALMIMLLLYLLVTEYFFPNVVLVEQIILGICLVVLGLILQFFRNPSRKIITIDNSKIFAPADGKIVIIEEQQEAEYFKDKRIQVSIFMSPFNVHVNRNPISGVVKFFKYHPGKYLVAWHPKSSTLNERTTLVIARDSDKKEILVRQIAGAVARRIRWYVEEEQSVVQGEDFGFIKFGSRVDIFLPLDAKIKVEMNQKVVGNRTIIAEM